MRSGRGCCRALAGALFAGPVAALAAIQVVGDAACGYYDVDIAAFATCVDGRFVKPEPPATRTAATREPRATPDAVDVASTPSTPARPRAGAASTSAATQRR